MKISAVIKCCFVNKGKLHRGMAVIDSGLN